MIFFERQKEISTCCLGASAHLLTPATSQDARSDRAGCSKKEVMKPSGGGRRSRNRDRLTGAVVVHLQQAWEVSGTPQAQPFRPA